MQRERWRLATDDDVRDIVLRLRPDDVEECYAMFGMGPQQFFETFGYDKDNTYVIFNSEGRNVALAGTARYDDQAAQMWMIATPLLEEHPIEFLRYSKAFIEETTKEYDLLFNWVYAANTVHLKWLKWCGFKFIQRHDRFGASGLPFYTFVMVK